MKTGYGTPLDPMPGIRPNVTENTAFNSTRVSVGSFPVAGVSGRFVGL